MPILTKTETDIMCGKLPSNAEKRYNINLKLRKFQLQVTDLAYIDAINALIPAAVSSTKKLYELRKLEQMRGEPDDCWNKIYHGEMNRLAREAGLRR